MGGGVEVHQRRACKGGRSVGAPGKGAPGGRRTFQFFKKSMKNLQFLTILMEVFANFSKKFLSFIELSRKFGKNVGKFWGYSFIWSLEAEPRT